MIAFNHVVPVLNLSVFNVRRAPAFAFEQSKRATIGGRFIRVDESRDLPLLHVVEDFTQKPVCSFAVTTGGEIKIDSAAPAVDGPVTDITYIRTHEGWLYLAVVVDLFSRKIIGWSIQPRMTKDIVLNALLMAVWRRNPEKQVLVHSDQGSQYTSHEWQSFLKSHGLEGSMSRRGNCHDNAVAESFFQLLKRERIKKKIYGTREEARSDIFDYIEMFYNSKRRHGSSEQMSPTEYENQYYQRLGSV